MCGIAGFNFPVEERRIFNSLFHRGPDEQSAWNDNYFFFFHTRLAIQDIQQGHQPFFFQNYLIFFNGEIYNHLELRENYLKEFKFLTLSDTETLLYLYLKFKEKMFSLIDGMFALAIYDTSSKKLFLARDRAGKKPLYLYQKGNKFGFASEINSLKFLQPQIDEEDIKLYLSLGFCESGYKEIKEFPPGFYGYFERGELKKYPYFDILPFYQEPKLSLVKEEIALIEEKLELSVKNRLFSSDVEVGAFLSGGIDSGLIVALASKYKNIKTFTVRFKGELDETALAKLTATKFNTQHFVLDIEMDVKEKIEEILLNYGKPFFDSSAIPSYFISKEARKYVKVVLNGDGADELFAGYRRYLPFYYQLDEKLKRLKWLSSYLTPQKRG
ncbi:MAG: asparagine synthase (glutamine-hydrolyzing), partial [Epsilonproteobacteria bacterium]|nr:asparagine synthase (glutamine-hydrolyzing) [Campylobacterota bacterium]